MTNQLQMKFLQQIIREAESLQIKHLRKFCTVYGTALRHIILGLNTSSCNLVMYVHNRSFPLYGCLEPQLLQDDPTVAKFPFNIAAVLGKTYIKYYFRKMGFLKETYGFGTVLQQHYTFSEQWIKIKFVVMCM